MTSLPALSTILAAAADTLDPEIYRRLFGIGGDREMVRLMIARARASGLEPARPPAACPNALISPSP